MSHYVPVVWKAPFSSYSLLDNITPVPNTYPYSISPDGKTVVGQQTDGTGVYFAVAWDTPTLAVTQLTPLSPGFSNHNLASSLSADSSVIYGNRTGGAGTAARWTSSTGALLSFPPGWDGGMTHGGDLSFQGVFRQCSDDGTVLCGNLNDSTGVNPNVGCRWLSGTPAALHDGVPNNSTAYSTSMDGARIVGQQGAPSLVAYACYWQGTTLRLLATPAAAEENTFLWASHCNHDASIIWGSCHTTPAGDTRWVYWDNTGTLASGRYGTAHFLPNLFGAYPAGSYQVLWAADNVGIAVGSSDTGDGSGGLSGITHGVKWTGATITDLGAPSGHSTQATGCSGDGSLICGNAINNSPYQQAPCYWDAGGTLHLLPVELPTDTIAGAAIGISRDGSVIYGIISVPDGPPPPPPPGVITIAASGGPGCTPYVSTEEAGPAQDPEWRLTVSDDGGRTWSTLVKTRGLGRLGQYLTRVRWLKMGQARQRMIRLECTDPVRRNIIGIYIDTQQGMG